MTIIQNECLYLNECLRETLSSIMRLTKACSPPGQTISLGVPPHAVLGLRPASSMLSKKGGLHMQKSYLSPSFTTPTRTWSDGTDVDANSSPSNDSDFLASRISMRCEMCGLLSTFFLAHSRATSVTSAMLHKKEVQD